MKTIFRIFKTIAILTLILTCCLIMNTFSQQKDTRSKTEVFQRKNNTLHYLSSKLGLVTTPKISENSVFTAEYLLDSDICRIPNVDPFDNSIKHLLRKSPSVVDCNENTNVFTYVQNSILYINSTDNGTQVSYCHYKSIYKDRKTFKYKKASAKFNSSVFVSDEFFKVECFNSSNTLIAEHFHVQFQDKRKITVSPVNEIQKLNTTHILKTSTSAMKSRLGDFEKYGKDTINAEKSRLNVLLIMMDSTSRINSLRFLPKTRKYLLDTLKAVELLGYNKVADNTMVNMVPFLTGAAADELPCLKDKHGVDNCTFIWKKFSKLGYVTHFAEDLTWAGMFNYYMPGFKYQPTDYYDHPFHSANEEGTKSQFDMCFHGKSSSQVLHDRMFDLVSKLGRTPYFSMSVHARMTHDFLEGAHNIDSITAKVLSMLYNNNLLNNTFLAVFGDHGMRFGPVRSSFVGYLEERLPMMFIYLPVWFKEKYNNYLKNLYINSKRLTTHFDMHSTLAQILNLDEPLVPKTHDHGISLFHEIPRNRSCEDAGIPPHWCTCNYLATLPDNVTTSNIIGKSVVAHLNNLLQKFKHKCRKLKLMNVQSCVKLSRTANFDEHHIVIETSPGEGLFEATVTYNKSSEVYDVIGDFSRINMYNGQSDCIQNKEMKKVCFCRI